MKNYLHKLIEHQYLSQKEAYNAFMHIASGEVNSAHLSAFMTVFLMRHISVDELIGFRNAMLDLCLKTDLKEYDAVDIVGTGGDGKNTFNISTLSCFVVAGAGYNVTKHGNYGVSSISGSSNVLEYLGHTFTNDLVALKRSLDRSKVAILHAPLFHPAMKHVAPVRKELGMRTFFNVLGPIANPSFPTKQVLGTYNLALARLYGYLFQKTEHNVQVIHALDGYDEISLTGNTHVINKKGVQVIHPSDFGFNKIRPEALHVGASVADAAHLFMSVLENTATEAQKNVVIANSAIAIQCFKDITLTDAVAEAKESLESGKALTSFKSFINESSR